MTGIRYFSITDQGSMQRAHCWDSYGCPGRQQPALGLPVGGAPLGPCAGGPRASLGTWRLSKSGVPVVGSDVIPKVFGFKDGPLVLIWYMVVMLGSRDSGLASILRAYG